MLGSILIVEDDLEQLQILMRRFLRIGYRVIGVQHPRHALQAASFQTFQVAILDASLPEIDGLELMKRLKRIQEGVQFVILSGYQYPELRARADGAFSCLVKPCSLKSLQATIESAFNRTEEMSIADMAGLLTTAQAE